MGGEEYEKFFTTHAAFSDPVITRDGSVEDAVNVMAQVASKYKSDTALLAPMLKGSTVEQTCRNIWTFIYTYIQYREDAEGIEQIRRPLRSWIERTEGVDCDCMSVFASSILKNLNIPHYFRITKYGKPEFQHVYVIVPTTGISGKGYYTIDGVIDAANKEKQFSDHKDFDTMKGIPIHVLNGLRGTADQDQDLYNYLVTTRNAIEKNPSLVQERICPCDAVPMFNNIIENWQDPHSRAVAIQKSAQFEAANFPHLNFFQKLWQYAEGSAQPGDVKLVSYIPFDGLGLLPDGAAGPPDPTADQTGTDQTGTDTTGSSDGNWWTSWGNGVSSFLTDMIKLGVTYTTATGNKITPTPTVTPTTIKPITTPTQAGMSGTTVLVILGLVGAAGFVIYSLNKDKGKAKTQKA